MNAADHTRYEEEVGPYLLGALDDSERREFERHLAGCRRCAMDVERLRPVAEALPRSVPQMAAPPGLKHSIMREVEGDAPRRSLPGFLRSLPSLRPAVALAGAAAALLLGVAVGVVLERSSDGAERTVAAEMDRNRLPGASGSLTVPQDGTDAVLRVNGMPRPPRGRVYQAWVERGGAVVPQPTFEVGRDGSGAAALTEDLEDAEAVLVTLERRGGARAPTARPLVSVEL